MPTRNLKMNSLGADVTALRKTLELLGYKISDRHGIFGPDTRTAVIDFQRANALRTTGVVNRATAAALAEAAEDAADDVAKKDAADSGANMRRIVRGRVTEANGTPLFVTVRAFSISLDGAKVLGRSRSDKTGWYEITYRWVGAYAPDIEVAAGPVNQEIARSVTRYNVGRVLRIDLVRGSETLRGLSEYDRIDARVSARFKNWKPDEIDAGELLYLVAETGIDAERLLAFVCARQFPKRIRMRTRPAAPIFYALFRQGHPTTIQGLAQMDRPTLEDALTRAVAHHFIEPQSARALPRLHAAVKRLARKQELRAPSGDA